MAAKKDEVTKLSDTGKLAAIFNFLFLGPLYYANSNFGMKASIVGTGALLFACNRVGATQRESKPPTGPEFFKLDGSTETAKTIERVYEDTVNGGAELYKTLIPGGTSPK